MPNSVSAVEQPLKHLGIKTWHSQHLGWNPCWELDMVGSDLGLPSGPRLLSAPQSVPGHDLCKTCPQCHSVPAAFPCPSCLPTLTVSRQALSICPLPSTRQSPQGILWHFYCSLLALLWLGKLPGVIQASCRYHFLSKLFGLREEKEEEELICSFSSHCCGITGMGRNSFPGSTGRIC